MGKNVVNPVALTLAAALAILPACSAHGSDSSPTRAQQPATKPVTLADVRSAPVPGLCGHEAGTLVNGQLPNQDPSWGSVAIAHVSTTDDTPRVAFGDLTGDGVDDAAMVTACNAGGVPWPATVQVYTAGPTLLGGVDLGDVTHGGRETVTGLSIADGMVRISWLTQGPDEPACCGTLQMSGDLRVSGARVDIENVRRGA